MLGREGFSEAEVEGEGIWEVPGIPISVLLRELRIVLFEPVAGHGRSERGILLEPELGALRARILCAGGE